MSDRLYKRGDVWHGSYWAGGRRIRVSTHCRDKRAAEAELRRLERRAHGTADPATDTPPHSVTDSINHLVTRGCLGLSDGTVRMYREKGGHLVRLLGDRDVNGLHVDDVAAYFTKREAEGAATESVRKERVTIFRALKLARARGILQCDPTSLIPPYQSRYVPRDRYLTLAEFQLLLAELLPHRQLWVVVAVFTAGRRSEVSALRWEHVDWQERTVLLPGTKTKKSRRKVPLVPLLDQVLRRCRGRSGLIVGAWGNVGRDLPAACKRAGIARATPNDLRRTYASWLKQAGVDSFTVAQLLGHSTSRMVELVYGRIDAATLARAAAHLPGCDTGVSHNGAAGAIGAGLAQPETRQVPGMSVSAVLGDGIEPSTRGFSVRAEIARTMPKPQEKELRTIRRL